MEKLDRAEELEEVQSDPDEKEAESEIDKIDNSLNVSIDTPSIRILNSLRVPHDPVKTHSSFSLMVSTYDLP
ncbi:hypothetical protein YC2023_060360 [Brassica napus]